MRVVVALGGNALLRRGEPAEAARQRRNVGLAAAGLAAAAREHELVVTHGNGPQVGLLALEAAAYGGVAPYPLDILGAESQGMIGYLLTRSLGDVSDQDVVAVLTQVLVDENDPAFSSPTKPIGPVYTAEEADSLRLTEGWVFAQDGAHVRRVVPSPEPRAIVELDAIRRLVETGFLVVCAGGGGIPVIPGRSGFVGVEAVVDKDLTAALLAEALGADKLVLLTDVSAVERGWRTPDAEQIGVTTVAELAALDFAAGSMAPKVDAACRFVDRTGRSSAIGSLDDLPAVLDGSAGTQVYPALAAVR